MVIDYFNGDQRTRTEGKLIWVRKDIDGDILFQIDQKGFFPDGTYRDIACDKFSIVEEVV